MNSDYRAELQGLRAWAVGIVLLYHLNPQWAPAGYIGVDVFFVLSGYLITGLLLRNLQKNRRIGLLEFYVRRLKRLFPALVTMIAVISGVSGLLLSGGEFSAVVRSAPFAVFWISNFHFALGDSGYFDALSDQDLFLHTWSLGVEEQFYLLWPALLIALAAMAKAGAGAGAGAGTLPRKMLLWGIALLTFVSLILSALLTSKYPLESFYLLHTRAWQFGLGGLIWMIEFRPAVRESVARLAGALKSIGLVALMLTVYLLPNSALYPGLWSLLPSLAAGLILFADHSRPEPNFLPLSHTGMIWIGDRSYSIYLWHFPIIGLMTIISPDDPVRNALFPLILTLALAHFSFELIERPFWKGRFSSLKASVTVAGAISASILAAIGVTASSSHLADRHHASQQEAAWRNDLPMLYWFNCDSWYHDAALNPCEFGNPAAKADRTIVLLGDSIGLQWFSFFKQAYADAGWKLVVLTKSACPIVDEPYFYDRIKRRYEICERWREDAIAFIESQSPRIAVIGNSLGYPFSELEWSEGSRRIFDRLDGHIEHGLVILGTPSLGFDGPGCAARNLGARGGPAHRAACRWGYDALQRTSILNALKRAAAASETFHVIDFSEIVCPGGTCFALDGSGQAIFRDSQHLTDEFVKSRFGELKDHLPSEFQGVLEQEEQF